MRSPIDDRPLFRAIVFAFSLNFQCWQVVATLSAFIGLCCVLYFSMQYLLVFRLLSGYTGERLIPGLRRKDWILRALLLAVTSLWPHKVGSRVEIYSARWKFMLIFWLGQRLSKKLCGKWGLYVSFSTAGLHPGSCINRLSVSREKFHVTSYVEKARVLRSNLTMFRPC